MSIQKLHYENISGMLIRRGGLLNWRCPLCKAEGQSREVMRVCPKCRSKEAALSCAQAQPAPSMASGDVSLISEGKTQPAQSVKDAIIDDLQSQFNTEGITENDSGDALIRLDDAIAAVEDNFALAQPAPIIPEAVMEVIAGLVYEVERNICNHEETHRGGQWEICDMCGAKWADDRGGKPEFKWPEVVEKARDMLAPNQKN